MKHSEEKKEYARQYYENYVKGQKKRNAAVKRKWYQEHREHENERQRRWYREHKEVVAEYQRRYRASHREQRNQYEREYSRLHRLATSGGKRWGELHKRPWPGFCEICGKVPRRLAYHHWDDNAPSKGIWVCLTCHQAVEAIDKGYHLKYLSLKKQVEAEYEPRALGEERPKTLQGALF